MARSSCDGCGRAVSIAGSVTNLWTFGQRDGSEGSALRLDLEDGSSHLLCYPCIEALPDHPSSADVRSLADLDHE